MNEQMNKQWNSIYWCSCFVVCWPVAFAKCQSIVFNTHTKFHLVLTWHAANSSIFKMDAVVSRIVGAGQQSSFSTKTSDIVKQDWADTLAKCWESQCSSSYSLESGLSADNLSIKCVPEVVADSAPGVVDAHFYTSLVARPSIHQTDISMYTH